MITIEQRETRRRYVGSSDAAAILGVDPERSAADVWLDKTGRDPGFDGNEATDRGNDMEPALRAFAARKLGREFIADRMFVHSSDLLCANLDGITADGTEAIEAKSTILGDDWGEDGSDETPLRVTTQVFHQFAVVETLRVIWVPMAIPIPIGGGRAKFDFRLYQHRRRNDLVDGVASAGIEFMQKYVIPAIRPDDFKPSLEVLRRIKREPNRIASISCELLDRFVAAKAIAKQAELSCESAYDELVAALEDAEEGRTEDGRRCTFFEQVQERIDLKRFRAARPDLASEFVKEIRFRKLLLPKK